MEKRKLINSISYNKSDIDYRFKIIYAIAIIAVACGHCNGGGIDMTLAGWFPLHSYHLSLFAFTSGYFYKDNASKNFMKYLKKKVISLILPLYEYVIIYGLITQLIKKFSFKLGDNFSFKNVFIGPILGNHQYKLSLGGWYVIPLFFVQIINALKRKIININNNYSEVSFFIIDFIMGNYVVFLSNNGYSKYQIISIFLRIFYFSPFYSLGILYKKLLEHFDAHINNTIYFSVIFIIKLAIHYYYAQPLTFSEVWLKFYQVECFVPHLICFLGISFWIRIAKALSPVIGKNKIINLISDNAFSIMMNQFTGFMCFKSIIAFLAKRYPKKVPEFSWTQFHNNLYYYYTPKNLKNMNILYLISGIAISIYIQIIINKIKSFNYFYR